MKTSTAGCSKWRPTWWAPLTPPTSTITGMTTARSSCSPLRSISRASIAAWVATIRPNGAAPGRGVRSRAALIAAAPGRSARGRRPRGVRWPRASDSGSTSLSSHQRETTRRLEASAGPVTTMVMVSSRVTSTRLAQRLPQRLGGVGGERPGHHQPDRRRAATAGELERRTAGDEAAVVDDVDVVGEALGLVHVVRGQHDRHARRRAAARGAPTWYGARRGPCRPSARRRRRSRAGRRWPSPARAAAAGRRRAGGRACGRTRRARAGRRGRRRRADGRAAGRCARSISSACTPLQAPPCWSITPMRGSSARRSRTGSSPSTRTVPCCGVR